jgi:transposase InsO family protein
MKANEIPLPDSWQPLVRKAMIHTVSLAQCTMMVTRGWGEYHHRDDVREAAKADKHENKWALQNRQLNLIKSRFNRIPGKKRPYYLPAERMDILMIKAANNWNLKQTAEAFMIEEATISSWIKRLDEEGTNALVKINEPVNKYPDFLQYASKQLKTLVPLLGKKKIAEYFMRAGLNLSTSTVGRFLKSVKPDKPFMPEPDSSQKEEIKVVTSRHPDHTWMIDLSVVPAHSGMWTSWIPYALPQVWPFCWWVAVIIDHYSRKVMGIAVFPKQPTSEDVVGVLTKTIKGSAKTPKYIISEDVVGVLTKTIKGSAKTPKYIISDKGMQFHPPKNAKDKDHHPYRKWCLKLGIRPRYGAIGKYGSIAIIERFMKTLKNECTRRMNIPLNIARMQEELVFFALWYNEYRPHSAFLKKQNKCEIMGARTPQEVYDKFRILNMPNAPPERSQHNCNIPPVKINISYFEGRKHLPIIEIKKAS